MFLSSYRNIKSWPQTSERELYRKQDRVKTIRNQAWSGYRKITLPTRPLGRQIQEWPNCRDWRPLLLKSKYCQNFLLSSYTILSTIRPGSKTFTGTIDLLVVFLKKWMIMEPGPGHCLRIKRNKRKIFLDVTSLLHPSPFLIRVLFYWINQCSFESDNISSTNENYSRNLGWF